MNRHCGVSLLAAVCIVLIALISSSAQLKGEKHVTSVEMVQLAEGARVTVNADAALNDYEAFRRGDRFYVKIPLAGFSFSQPRFHGNGFDDVQVQKVGDSVVVSFKLQLGASARVEQHANRLEVVFTVLNRGQNASSSSNRPASSGIRDPKGNQGSQARQSDAAGPVPADASKFSRQRYASAPDQEVNRAQYQSRKVRVENNTSKTTAPHNQPLASSSPLSVASPTPSSSYPATSSYTPAASAPVASSKPALNSTNSKLRDWFSANRKAALLAGLILAGLLVLAAAYFYRGRKTKSDDARARRPLAQPKYESRTDLEEMTETPAEPAPVVAPIIEATKSGRSAAPRPTFAPAAEIAASHASVFSKPSNSSVVVADANSGNEEREVFEL